MSSDKPTFSIPVTSSDPKKKTDEEEAKQDKENKTSSGEKGKGKEGAKDGKDGKEIDEMVSGGQASLFR
jgi:hypothetical protein